MSIDNPEKIGYTYVCNRLQNKKGVTKMNKEKIIKTNFIKEAELINPIEIVEGARLINPIVFEKETAKPAMINPIIIEKPRKQSYNKTQMCGMINPVEIVDVPSGKDNFKKVDKSNVPLPNSVKKFELTELEKVLMQFPYDDSGNVDRFLHYYGDILCFNIDADKFFIWNGKFWEEDTTKTVKKMAEKVMMIYRDTVKKIDGLRFGANNDIAVHALNSCNNSKLNALVEMLKHRTAVKHEIFDTHPALLNVKNGVVDLRTGHLEMHRKELYITAFIDIEYLPSSSSNEFSCFSGFIKSISCNSVQLSQFIQKCFGYGITGETREQKLFILHGSGSNGKSTLIEALANVVSDYVKHLPVEVLLNNDVFKSGAKPSPELAQTTNSRMLFLSELNEGESLNEGKVKNLTGEGRISVRKLYCEPFEFAPKFKIFMDTNHLPSINGHEFSVRRRIKIIPFDAVFTGENLDKRLPAKLKSPQEKSEILRWLIDGAVKYYRYGLGTAPEVEKMTADYFNSHDSIGAFLNNIVIKKAGASIEAQILYQSYCEFCNRSGMQYLTQKVFGSVLKQLGYEKKRKSSGYFYENIDLQ